MRRTTLAVFVLMLAALPAGLLLAQSQDPLITSARRMTQQGEHDSAISMLRFALASRPADEALKQELVAVLRLKQNVLRQEMAELSQEIAALRGAASPRSSISASSISASRVGGTAPVRVGGDIKAPLKRVDVKPVYPPLAQESRVQGVVILEAMIDPEGNVADAKVLRGQPLLNDAAVEAVRQWRYTPTLLNGVPVPVIMTVTVSFTLQD